MRVIYRTKENSIATVYIARTWDGKMLEFVESTQPPYTREEKWVLIVSTLFGCPVGCRFCDAGSNYKGKVSYEQIMFQIDYLLKLRFRSNRIDTDKFKIQFARMGEPAFNEDVIRVLEDLPDKYVFKNFIPSISTVAPESCGQFFERLLEVRKKRYPLKFQLQFSIHSTIHSVRDELIPVKKWDFPSIAEYGHAFYNPGGTKIVLNFALSKKSVVDPAILLEYFNPERFIIKLTPVNPTLRAVKNNIESSIKPGATEVDLSPALRKAGYDVILSIGEWEENKIGSNCGQYISAVKKKIKTLDQSYTYGLKPL